VALFRETIACGDGLPRGTYLRLMMWHDALEVWSHALVLGNGIGWQDLYRNSFYSGTGYEVVHNGYLEIAMRYGIVGIAFTLLVFGWSIAMARRACRQGLIAPEALRFHVCAAIYFLATMATNANNRLAIGESYMTAVGAFGFCCLYLIAFQRGRTADERVPDQDRRK
jgi:O-antigen ligase